MYSEYALSYAAWILVIGSPFNPITNQPFVTVSTINGKELELCQ